ncbi:MAG: FG-GAP-like repeat-containing protein [Patescibacteria group bacterium]|jgi:RHS repeat-associated protein
MPKSNKFVASPVFFMLVFLFIFSWPWLSSAEDGDPMYGYERETNQGKLNIETDSATGAFIFNYPIVVPPGRNGIQPDLNLSYNNQSEDLDSPFGYGWSINIPYIERINRKGSEDLFSTEYFYSSMSGELRASSTVEGMIMASMGRSDTPAFYVWDFKISMTTPENIIETEPESFSDLLIDTLEDINNRIDKTDIPEAYQLKVDKKGDILESKEIDWVVKKEDGTLENKGKIMVYDYISDKKVSQGKIERDGKFIEEDLSKRTGNARFYKTGKKVGSEEEIVGQFYSGTPFIKVGNEWHHSETATTTVEAFKKQTGNNLIGMIFGVGATAATSTIYSGSGDGRTNQANADWNTCRNATTGNDASYTQNYLTPTVSKDATLYYIGRSNIPADTSSLPDDTTISEATLHVYKEGGAGTGTTSLAVVTTSQASPISLTAADYDQYGSADLGNFEVSTSDANETEYTASISDPEANISKTGYTMLGLRDKTYDMNNLPQTGYYYTHLHSSEYTGTDYDPYYEITYTMPLAPSTPSDLLVENLANPSAVFDNAPEFSAIYNDLDSGDNAVNYQLQVSASNTDWTSTLWDSGKTFMATTTEGSRCNDISYASSAPLPFNGATYYWRIKFWDDENNEGAWSDGNNYFTMSGEYGAKSENGDFIKYEYINAEKWTATTKDGTVYKFGHATSTKQFDSATSTNIFKWMLEEVRDRNNNYIKYEYYNDNGQIYPYKIIYTGNNTTDGIFEVEFLRESRDDAIKQHNSGFKVQTGYRIYEIKANINGAWARKYELDYITGDNDKKSLLDSITESGINEQNSTITLPKDEFAYQAKTKSWTHDDGYTIPTDIVKSDGKDVGARFAEVNGDGLIDVITDPYVYTNDGDGTGWTVTDYNMPVYSTNQYSNDLGVRIADVNGDGLADILQSTESENKVYIKSGSDTGWIYDSNYTIPEDFIFSGYKDAGVRLVDVNGDGLTDIIFARDNQTKKVYINDGDGTGWTENNNYKIPGSHTSFVSYRGEDMGVRLLDANGDGLVDILRSINGTREVYINKGDGTGWFYAGIGGFALDFASNIGYDNGVRFADVNGDGLIDMLRSYDGSYAVYINQGVLSGSWVLDAGYIIPVDFIGVNAYGRFDNGARLADVNGDGLDDILYSRNGQTKKVYISDNHKADLLSQINHSKGAETKIYYKGSPGYLDSFGNILNPNLPIVMQTVKNIAVDDGLGNIATTTYEYQGGDYYYNSEYDNKLAGFNKIVKIDGNNNITNIYYHQGNDTASTTGEFSDDVSKIGRVYRTEVYNNDGKLYSKSINKWEKYALGNERDFVKLTRSVDYIYDGDSDHKDKATTYDYDDAYGNITEKVFWGEVTGSDDGTFTDAGADKASTIISYAASTTLYVVGLPSQETTYNQSDSKIKETKYYYDNLSSGNVAYGNLTKEEKWKSGNDYIDIEKTYNTYGLVTQEKDPRDKAINYTYDVYNLYKATSTNPLSQSADYYYDYSAGKIKKTVDPNNRVFEVIYDGLDRITEERQPDIGSPSSLATKTNYIYYHWLSPRSVKQVDYLDGATSIEKYTYIDGLDRVVQERKEAEDSNFSVKDFTYNDAGLLEIETLPYFSTGTSTSGVTSNSALYMANYYDPLGRVATSSNVISTTTYAYDQWRVTITDALNNTKDLYKDAYDNLIQVDEHSGTSTYSTLYEYNLLGNLTKITDALSNERNFTYDNLGRLLNSEDLHAPGDSYFSSVTMAYDDSGNLIERIDGKNQTVDYTYDDINRISTENYLGLAGTEVEYGYDNCTEGVGRLCHITSSEAISSYTYNALGLIKTETRNINSVDYSTAYDYDRRGQQTLITYPDNSQVRYAYNNAGLMEAVDQKENGEAFSDIVSDFDYNPQGDTTYEVLANYTSSAYTYDENNLYRLINKLTAGPEEFIMASMGKSDKPAFYMEIESYDFKISMTTPENIPNSGGSSNSLLDILEDQNNQIDKTGVPEAYQLKVDNKSDILESREEDWIEIKEDGSIENKGRIMSYDYISDKKLEGNFLFNGRQYTNAKIVEEKENTKTIVFYSGDHFYQGEDGIYEIVHGATTTIEAFLGQTKVSWLGKIFGQEAFATDYYTSSDKSIYTQSSNFSTAHDATSGTVYNQYVTCHWSSDGNYQVQRYFANIDTSAIGPGYAVTAASFTAYTGKRRNDNAGNMAYNIYNSSHTDPADPDSFNDAGTTAWSTDKSWGSLTPDGFFTWDFNTAGKAGINMRGTTFLSARESYYDVGDVAPVANNTEDGYSLFLTSNAGSNDPYLSVTVTASGNPPLSPTDLLAEGQSNPTGVTDLTPEFSAIYTDSDSGDSAVSYQLQVSASSTDWTSLMWDSDKSPLATTTEGSRSPDISYNSITPLEMGGPAYYWRIKFWDDEDTEGAWSTSTASFIMAGSNNIQNFNYTYDDIGNIAKIEDYSNNNGAKIIEFNYDDLYRLTRASSTMASSTNFLETYSYNAIGNITNKLDVGNYLYQGNSGTSQANPHAATSIDGATNAYDHNGNLTSDGIWDYTWDYRNRLIEATNGTSTLRYGYDHEDNRIWAFDGVATTTYINKYYNISSTGTSTINIFANNQLVATIEGNGIATSTYYIHTDHLGGSNVITDENGDVVQLLDYYPFGGIRLNEKESDFDEARKFTGHEYDAETGLNYMIARYQNPAIGRFVSQDKLVNDIGIDTRQFKQKYGKEFKEVLSNPQELNSYSYVTNNPLKYRDPNGDSGFSVVFEALGKGLSRIAGPFAVASYAYDLFKPSPAGGDLDKGQSYTNGTIAPDKQNNNFGTGAVVAGTVKQSGMQIGSKVEGFGEVIGNTPGKITGFFREGAPNPYHGLDQAITRGVSPSEIIDTVKNPLITFRQGNGNIYRLTEKAAVVLNQAGKVVTIYGKSDFYPKVVQLLTKIIK